MPTLIKTTRRNVVYDNRYVTVYDDDVEFPNGTTGKYFRCRWKAPHGVAVVPITADGFVLLIVTHKYGNETLTREIPQGFGMDGSTPELDAYRELFEETGYETKTLEPMFTLGGDFETHVFRAMIDKGQGPTDAYTEDKEAIVDYEWLRIDDITPARLQELCVLDPVSVAALLAVRLEQPSRYHVTPSSAHPRP